jgi:hypothetical protein
MSEWGRQNGGDAGVPPIVRDVNPPLPVWVDARHVWPHDPHAGYTNTPAGVELRHEVLGLLRERVLRADGGWVGRVEVRLFTQDKQWSLGPITQIVPSHLIRPHRPGRRGRADSGLGH